MSARRGGPGGGAEQRERIEREILVPARIERVWRLVTEPVTMREWFPGTTLVVQVGGAATFDCGAAELFHGVVEAVEPPHRLAWRWCHEAGRPVDQGATTRVEILLETEGEATRLRLVESGFSALTAADRARILAGNRAAWDFMLPRLPGLALSAGDEDRTEAPAPEP